MIRLKEKYQEDIFRSRERLKRAYAFENESPPVYIVDAPWWQFGEAPENIPEDYCSGNFKAMMDYQISKIKTHFERGWNDCMEPVLTPWYGTGVLPSAFGLQVEVKPFHDPASGLSPAKDYTFVENLCPPDPYKDGQMPLVLKTIDFFRENCDLDVNITDCQGPLSTAFNMVGYENFIYWAVDCPEIVHMLMDKVTDALIAWIRIQKRHIGIEDDMPVSMSNMRILDGYGGILLSDDDATLLGPEIYKEFVVPYVERVLAAFGGGGLHCCGNVAHQAENFCSIKGLTLYHNNPLGNFEAASITQKKINEKGIIYIVGDYAVTDDTLDLYFNQLFSSLNMRGLIIETFISPIIAMVNGRYEKVRRDPVEVGKRIQTLIGHYQKESKKN